METITFNKCEQDFCLSNTSLIPATQERMDISIDQYSDFLTLTRKWEIPIVFYHLVQLEEYEIEDQLILEEDLESGYVRYIKDKLTNETQEFNEALEQLRGHIGEEQEISLFFTREGIITDSNIRIMNYIRILSMNLLNQFWKSMMMKLHHLKEKR